MSDAIDDAQALDERLHAAAIADAQAHTAGDGRNDCEDCGEPIEAARRRAAPWATRCVTCQSLRERHQYRGR